MTFPTNRHRKEKISSLLEHLAAEFIVREADNSSLITVTGSRLSDSGQHIDILVTVLPEEKEEVVKGFLARHKAGFAEYINERAKIGRTPKFDFKIDKGEKNRRVIEDIL